MSKWADFNEQVKKLVDWRVVGEEILGLELIGEPGPKGWVKCKSIDGEDENPSAGFNVVTGYYKDFKDGQTATSAYDMMVQIEKANTFMEAKKVLAKRFGILFPTIDPGDPMHGVKWQNWNDNLAKPFCISKPPITVDGLKRADARMCMRYGEACFALPVWDSKINVVGWMFIPRSGMPFQHEAAKGAKSICKIEDGCVPYLITGRETIEYMKREWEGEQGGMFHLNLMEGAPDMLAGMSRFPDASFATNPHGCMERMNETNNTLTMSGTVTIIADADVPGCQGAYNKWKDLTNKRHKCEVMMPPYEVEEKHGKDYRDYLNANPNLEYPNQGLVEVPSDYSQPARQEIHQDESDADAERSKLFEDGAIKTAGKTLQRVGVTITGVDGTTGRMSVYSAKTGSTRHINDLATWKYVNWVQFLGQPFADYVYANVKEYEVNQSHGKRCMTFSEFTKQTAIMAAEQVTSGYEECGCGVWGVHDDAGVLTGDVMINQYGSACLYSANTRSLSILNPPVYGGMCADMSAQIRWFDTELLATYLKQAEDPEWRSQVYNELYAVFNQWNFDNDSMPQLVIGLVMATAMQSMLKWRPVVTITGESNSGKTFLMKQIAGLFGSLTSLSAASTTAGIMQSLGCDARPLLLDEFDSGKEQTKLLKRFRTLSRGQDTLQGTCFHQARIYRAVHLPWISGIHASSNNQADTNRMIALNLLARTKNSKTIKLLDDKQARELGLKMIAGVIVTCRSAAAMIEQLSMDIHEAAQARYRESYAVPFGCLGAFLGLDPAGTQAVMDEYIENTVAPEILTADAATDQESLLLDILQTEVRLGMHAPEEVATVAEILFSNQFSSFRDACRTKGVAYVAAKKGSSLFKVCFAGRLLIRRKGGLLGDTQWADIPGVLQILGRLPASMGTKKENQVIAGTCTSCVSVDYNKLKDWADSKTQRPVNAQEAV